MPTTYVAQTREHTLILDDDGVCLYVHRRTRLRDAAADASCDGAIRCVGAQYVAALDARQPGLLAHEPAVGAPMLFAKVGERGRISVVRTGPIERFEARGSGIFDAVSETGGHTGAGDPEAVELLPDDLEDDERTMEFRRAAGSAAWSPTWARVRRAG